MPDDLAQALCGLASRDSSERARSGEELFRRGVELARPVVENWLEDPNLAAEFILDESHFPEATVGLAVTPGHFEEIRAACGSPGLATVPPDQDAREFELHFGQDVRLDILTTAQPGGAGAIARFLQKSGEGVQQVELLVRDVNRVTEKLRVTRGLAPIYPRTRPGADGTRVNFFLLTNSKGSKVLIELVEAPQ